MRTGLVRPLLGSALCTIALSFALSGCFCSALISDDWDDWDDDGWGYCDTDADCFEGCVCNGGECVETGWCMSDEDCEGAACDTSRNTCMGGGGGEPGPAPGECADDLCPEGCYWDPAGGGCIETATCSMSGDPNCFSDEVCDVEQSTCVPVGRVCMEPEPGPGPDPTACTYSSECPELQECVDGSCVTPPEPGGGTSVPGCTFNYECGLFGTCIDGECHANCADSSTCPIGQICDAAGVCVNDPMPTPECATNAECTGGSFCINAICFPGCTKDGDCGAGEFCKRDVCRPDFRPTAQCLYSSECAAGEECVDAVCRVRCWGDEWCTGVGPGSVCDVAWCTFPEEATANCSPDVACAAGESCVNGSCLAG